MKTHRPYSKQEHARFLRRVSPQDENGCQAWTGRFHQGNQEPRFAVYRNGRMREIGAHIMAYEIFIGKLPKKAECVWRTCGNARCVSPLHLRAGTFEQMRAEIVHERRHAYGRRNAKAKLTPDRVRRMRAAHAAGRATYADLARLFNISPKAARKACLGITWKHIE